MEARSPAKTDRAEIPGEAQPAEPAESSEHADEPTARISPEAWSWTPGPISLTVVGLLLRLISHNYRLLQRFLELMPAAPADAFSRARALRTARRAAGSVPAYTAHLDEHGFDIRRLHDMNDLPETDKRSYVDRHPLTQRCERGRLPLIGTTIDESSGSTGHPYNWARSAAERHHARRMIAFFARYTFGSQPLVVLNSFSMGAWATGMTTAAALEKRGLVKATGPDIEKIIGTMRELGPGYRYLIVGYPPFLKVLLDEGERSGFDWAPYTMHALLGGEGNSESLRDYLLRRFTTVFSGYGVTDVEIGLAAETPICIALRRLAMKRADVAVALFGEADRSPMLFQFNPFYHHIETNDAGELLFTVARDGTLMPKVRYNPHDEGGVLRDDELRARLASVGVTLEELRPPGSPRLIRMPYLYVFGRKDSTISVMGANIYPEDIESAVYSAPDLAKRVLSYQLSVLEEQPGETRPAVAIQLLSGEPDDAFRDEMAALLTDRLRAMNRDYGEASREYPALMPIVVTLHRRGEGPFAGTEGRIKFRYIAPPAVH